MVAGEIERAARRLLQILRRCDEIGPDVISKVTAASYTGDQVLGDWFPGDAPLPDNRGEE